MVKDDIHYLGHIADAARKITGFVGGKSRADFDADEMLRLAVVHLVQTIGEAARLVTVEFQAQHPQLPWRQMIGMRNRLVHDYLNVDYDVVWQVAIHDIPQLIELLQATVGVHTGDSRAD